MKVYTYEIFEDGYNIYATEGGKRETTSQRGILSKNFVYNGTYEDNAKAQIAEMQAQDTAQATQVDEFKKIRADVDFLLLNSGAEVLA